MPTISTRSIAIYQLGVRLGQAAFLHQYAEPHYPDGSMSVRSAAMRLASAFEFAHHAGHFGGLYQSGRRIIDGLYDEADSLAQFDLDARGITNTIGLRLAELASLIRDSTHGRDGQLHDWLELGLEIVQVKSFTDLSPSSTEEDSARQSRCLAGRDETRVRAIAARLGQNLDDLAPDTAELPARVSFIEANSMPEDCRHWDRIECGLTQLTRSGLADAEDGPVQSLEESPRAGELRFRGRLYHFSGKNWKLLHALWHQRMTTHTEVCEQVWDKEPKSDSTIRAAVVRLNATMVNHGIPLRWNMQGNTITPDPPDFFG
jgi:hypothetical protein